ncbi:MAG: hypothetical protein ABW133_14940 [Polyangiaceae bacterium]
MAACGGRTTTTPTGEADPIGDPTGDPNPPGQDPSNPTNPTPDLDAGPSSGGGCTDIIVETKAFRPDTTCEIQIPPFPAGIPYDFAHMSVEKRVNGAYVPVNWVGICRGPLSGWLVVQEGRALLCPNDCVRPKIETGDYRVIFRCTRGGPMLQPDSGL